MFDFNLDFNFDLGFDDNDADDSKTGYQPEIKNRYLRAKKFKQVPERAVMYDNALDLVAQMGDYILKGETVHALLSGNFIFGDIIQALAVQKQIIFHDITLSTLSFSQENIDMFAAMIQKSYIQRLGIIVSDYFWSHNRHNAPYIYEALDHKDIFQLAVAGVHTKITLLDIQGPNVPRQKIVISGSANLRSSRSVEFVTFEANDLLYDFHHQWHLKILEDYGTIDQGVAKRAGALWDKIIEGVEHKDSWSKE
jgi:hypothetical protein